MHAWKKQEGHPHAACVQRCLHALLQAELTCQTLHVPTFAQDQRHSALTDLSVYELACAVLLLGGASMP